MLLKKLLDEVTIEGNVCLSPQTERTRRVLKNLLEEIQKDPSMVWKLLEALLADGPVDLSHRALPPRSRMGDLERELVFVDSRDTEPRQLEEAGIFASPPIGG
jgi:hypothetical protein